MTETIHPGVKRCSDYTHYQGILTIKHDGRYFKSITLPAKWLEKERAKQDAEEEKDYILSKSPN